MERVEVGLETCPVIIPCLYCFDTEIDAGTVEELIVKIHSRKAK